MTYLVLLILLTLAYGPLKPYRSESARLPLMYWAATFAITGSIWRLFGYPGWQTYFLILSTASFLLILAYHTLDITLPLLVAWLAELTLMAIYLGCALQSEWALSNWREAVPVLNNVGLLAVIWGYADGSGGYASRVLYPRLFDSPRMRHSVSMRNVSTNRQMGEEIR